MRNIVILNSLHFSYPLPILMRVSYNTLIVKQNTSDYYKYTNKPRAKANLFAFCRGEVSKKKSKIRKGGRNYECLLSKISGSVLSSAKMMRGEDRAEFV